VQVPALLYLEPGGLNERLAFCGRWEGELSCASGELLKVIFRAIP